MSNPIKSSDLYQDDGAITGAIKQMNELRKVYTDSLDDITKQAKELIEALKGVNNSTKEGRTTTRKAATDADRLKKAQKEYAQALSSVNIQIRSLQEARRDAIRQSKLELQVANNAVGSYKRLTAQYALNKLQLNKMSKEQRSATKSGVLLERQTKEIFEEMNRLQKATGKATLQVGQYERAQNRVTGAINNGIKSALRLGLTYLGLSAIISKVGEAVDITTKLESTDLALRAVVEDSEELAKTQEFLIDISERYGSEIISLTDSYVKFSAATKGTILEGEATRDIFDKVTKVTSLLGLGSEETTGALRALGQMMSKGKVQAEELRGQLGDRIPGAFNIMAKAMDVTLPQLDKLLEQGKVIAKDVLPDFATQLERVFGADKIDRIDTLRASFIRIRNAFVELVAAIEARDFLKNLSESTARFIQLTKENIGAIKSTIKFLILAGAAYLSYRTVVLAATLAEKLRLVAINRLIVKQGVLTTVTNLSKKATEALSVALKRSPIGIIATVLTTAAIAFLLFKDNTDSSRESLILWKDETDEAVESQEDLNKELEETSNILGRDTYDKFIQTIGKLKIGFQTLTGSGNTFKVQFDENVDVVEKFGENVKNLREGELKNLKTFFDKEIIESTRALRGLSDGLEFDVRTQDLKRFQELLGVTNKELAFFEEARKQSAGGEEVDPFKIRSLQLKAMEEGIEKELATLELGFDKNKALFEENGLVSTQLTLKFENDKENIREKFRVKNAIIAAKELKEAQDADDLRFKQELEAFDQSQDLTKSENDLKELTEKEAAQNSLQLEKERLLEILRLNKLIGGQISDLQVQTIRNTIKAIDEELGDVAKKKDIYELLGLKLNDKDKQAISDSLRFSIDNVKALLQARLQAAEQALRAAQQDVQNAQTVLTAEIEARNQGFANRVEGAQKDLELQRISEAKALKEKERAARAQQLIDTATQVSGLITASVQIWKSLSGIPIVGPGLAIAAVGTLFASYAASKIQAKAVASEEFGGGGFEILNGPSHSRGGVEIGSTRSGKRMVAEGQESVGIFTKKATRNHKSVIHDFVHSINKGTYEGVQSNVFSPDIVMSGSNSNLSLNKVEDLLDLISRKKTDSPIFLDTKEGRIEVYKGRKTNYGQ